MPSVLQKFSDNFLCRYDTYGSSCVVGLLRDAEDRELINFNFVALADCVGSALTEVSGDLSPELGGDLDAGGFSIFNFLAEKNEQTGLTYETVGGDSGKVLVLNNAAPVTVTIHDTAPEGFNLLIVQEGAGQVTVAAGGTGVVRNFSGHSKLAGQYAMANVFVESNAGTAPQVYLGGDTAV